jgi:hypothetical protein
MKNNYSMQHIQLLHHAYLHLCYDGAIANACDYAIIDELIHIVYH